jgi:hypothetical protein
MSLYDLESYVAGQCAGLGKHHDERAALAARLAEAEALLQEALDAGIEECWMHTPNGDAYDESAALRERIAAFLAVGADK